MQRCIFLLLLNFACLELYREQPSLTPASEGILLIPSLNEGKLNYRIGEESVLSVGTFFSVTLLLQAYSSYFHQDGRTKASKQIDENTESYYEVEWDITTQETKQSLLKMEVTLDEDAFNVVNYKAQAQTGAYKGAFAYFYIGENIEEGFYLLSATLSDGDPDGKKIIRKEELKIEVIKHFVFKEDLKVIAKAVTLATHSNIYAEKNSPWLAAAPLHLRNGAKEAAALLELREPASSEKQKVFVFDFRFKDSQDYHIVRYKEPSWPAQSDSVESKISSIYDSSSVEASPASPAAEDFPLEITDYLLYFNAEINAGKVSDKRGKVVLEVEDTFGRVGDLTIEIAVQ